MSPPGTDSSPSILAPLATVGDGGEVGTLPWPPLLASQPGSSERKIGQTVSPGIIE